MRKRTMIPMKLDESQISEQSLISYQSSSRSFINPIQPLQLSQPRIATSQLHLIQKLGLKYVSHASPTQKFVEYFTNTIDTKTIKQQFQAQYLSQYTNSILGKKQKQYLKMVQIDDIDYVKIMPIQKWYQKILKLILFITKSVSLFCRKILAIPLFQIITTIIIIGNSFVIAWSDPLTQILTQLQYNLEIFFLAFYIFQFFLKVFAYGLILHKDSYLRDLWNLMDLLIIVASFTQFFTFLGFSANSLRVFRVLKPLRTITKVSSLKMVLKTLFSSISLIFDSIVLLGIAVIIFTILGVQVFGGLLKFRCMDIKTGIFLQTLCSSKNSCVQFGQSYECVKGIQSPNYSIINFDSVPSAFINIFQIFTMQGWSTIMVHLQAAFNVTGAIYCIAIIFVCQLALLNITLAILKYKFSQIKLKNNDVIQDQQPVFDIQKLKKLLLYYNFSQRKTGTQIPSILQGKVGAIQINKHSQFNNNTNIRSNKKHMRYNRVSSQTKSIRHRLSAQVSRPSGSKNIRIFDQIIQSTDYSSIPIKQIQYKMNQYHDEQQCYLIQSDEQSQQQIQTQKLINNNNAQYESLLQAQEKNMLMFSLLYKRNPKKAQFIQFQKVMDSIFLNFNIDNEMINNVNSQLLDIVVHNKKVNQFSNIKIKKVANNNKKISKKHTVRKSIQDLLKDQQMDMQQIKFINQVKHKELRLEIQTSKQFDCMFQENQNEIFKNQCFSKRKNNFIKNLKVVYKTEYDNKKMKGYIKIAVRPIQQREFRSNRILNTHFITQQQQEAVIDQNIQAHKQIFKITFKKPNKHKNRQRVAMASSTNKVFNIVDINKWYFQNQNLTVQNSKSKTQIVQHVDTDNQDQLGNKNETNQQKWMRICIQQNKLQRLEFKYPPCQIFPQFKRKMQEVFPSHTKYNIYIPGFGGFFKIIRNQINILVESSFYDNFILALVILNTLVLAATDNSNSNSYSNTILNQIFTFFFTIDIALKLIVYGLSFFEDFLNLFDLIIVVLSLFQLAIIGESSINATALRSIRVFRIFRVLRITRLVRSLSFMSVISDIISSVFYQFIYIFLLLGLFIFVYVLLGMQIFGGSFLPQSVSGVRQNFDSFGNAFLTIFQLITVQNWNDLSTALILSSTNSASIIFLIAGIFIGNWVLLNLVQAILLQNFEIQRIKMNERKQQNQNQKSISNRTTQNFNQSIYTETNTITKTPTKSLTYSRTQNLNAAAHLLYLNSHDYSWWLFKSTGFIRMTCIKIVTSCYFDYFVYFFIILSCGKLIFDTYINATDFLFQIISYYINIVINICFFIQFILKTIAYGFMFSPKAYLKDNWNKLDFLIVINSILDFGSSNNLGIIKVFRAFRPLKLVSKNMRMRVMIQALFQSANGIANVGIVVLLVFVMFGILYMNLLQNKLNYCDIGQGQIYGPYNIDKTTCQQLGFTWRIHIVNFQNIIIAMVSLFIFSTRQNWVFYHYSFVDADENGPVLNNNPILFICISLVFIFVCSYFLIDLFVGVIFLNYHITQSKLNPKKLTSQQDNWIQLQKCILKTKPYFLLYAQPSKPFKKKIFSILKHKYYTIMISVLLGINTIVFMMQYDDMTVQYHTAIIILNCIFTSIFLLDLLLKLITFPISQYFLSIFNVLQTIVIFIGIIDYVQLAGYIDESTLLDALKFIRLMRTFRLFRFVKTYKSLQKLIYIIVYALPSIGYAISILCLYLLMCSIVSSTLFGNMSSIYTHVIDSDHNFKDFHHALQMLFVCLTGQNWYYYMFASMSQEATCAEYQIGCTNTWYLFFWIPFIFIGQRLIMELFVLLILDQFQNTFIQQNNPIGLFDDLQDIFRPAWIQFANRKTWTIKPSQSVDLCLKLNQPLGLNCAQQLKKFQAQLKSSFLLEDEIIRKNYQFLSKMRQSSMKWVSKLQLPNNQLIYQRAFYCFAKAVFYPEPSNCKPQQIEILQQQQKDTLEKLYLLQGNNSSAHQVINPFKRQLLIQIALQSWVSFANINFTYQEWQDGDSILMQQQFEPPSLKMIKHVEKNEKAKLIRATSIKVKRQQSHKHSSKMRDKQIPNPQNLYKKRGRISLNSFK